jgi:MazG family protein
VSDPEPPAGAATLRDLVALVERLRRPDGCPWDREQRLPDVRAYLVEEAHEAAAAIDAADWRALGEELGDLLFQVAFVLRLGEEAGELAAEDVVAGVHAKMVARHPHVFGGERLADAAAVRAAWERRKRDARAGGGLLAGVPASLPALVGAYRVSQKAAGVGFDWPDAAAVLAKVREELAEVEAELGASTTSAARSRRRGEGGADASADASSDERSDERSDALESEIGDLLFAVANLARHLGIDPERALAGTNAKFRRRFGHLERRLSEQGRGVEGAELDELEALWQEAKAEEGAGGEAPRRHPPRD